MNRRFDIKVFFGLAIILAGIILFLDNTGIIPFNFNLFDFWPLIFVIIGLNMVTQPKESRQAFTGWVFISFGALFLLRSFDVIYFRFGELWPLILILVGLAILKNNVWKKPEGGVTSDYINLSFVLGGGDHKYTSKTLRGGSVTAVMGGGTIDLRNADSPEDPLIIDTFTWWGGIEIIVPYHWQVNIQGTPILGGMENNTRSPESIEGLQIERKPVNLIIKGSAIMGGVEVKN